MIRGRCSRALCRLALGLLAAALCAASGAGAAEIHDAAQAGDADRLRSLLAADPAQRAALDAGGATALHLAKDEATALLLLEAGVPLDVKDARGRTAVEAAAADGRIDVASAILNHIVKFMENVERLAAVLGQAATADAAGIAIQKQDLAALTAVLDKNPDVVKQTTVKQKFTPLEVAVIEEWTEGTQLLLERGADPNVRDPVYGSSPLHEAVSGYNVKIAALLLDHGADIDLKAKEGDPTPLHLAAVTGDGEMIAFLIERGADAGLKNKDGLTPFDIARGGENEWAIHLLGLERKYGAKRFLAGQALIGAAYAGDVAAIERIAGGDKDLLKFPNALGQSPLHVAADAGRAEAVSALLRLGADPGLKSASGKTAADLAADNATRAAFGLAASFPTKEVDAYLAAAASGSLDTLREILDHSPQIVDAQNQFQSTALQYAASAGKAAAVELLLSRGANPKLKDDSGNTAKDEAKSRLKQVKDPAAKAALNEVLAVFKKYEK